MHLLRMGTSSPLRHASSCVPIYMLLEVLRYVSYLIEPEYLPSLPIAPQSNQHRGGAIVMQLISIAMQQISVLVFTSLGPTWCSQHGDGQGAEGHRTSLGLVSHQAPW